MQQGRRSLVWHPVQGLCTVWGGLLARHGTAQHATAPRECMSHTLCGWGVCSPKPLKSWTALTEDKVPFCRAVLSCQYLTQPCQLIFLYLAFKAGALVALILPSQIQLEI